MARDKQKKPGEPDRTPMSEEAVLADIERKHTWARAWRTVLTTASLGIVLLCATPIAYFLAGETTILNFSIGITFTVSIAIAGAGAAVYANEQRKRANRLNSRNKGLSRDVKELQRRLRDNGLPDDVTRS